MTEKQWVRSRTTGDLGYLIKDPSGVLKVRRDSPNDPSEFLYTEEGWDLERPPRRLQQQQIAKVAFEADRAVCQMLGLYMEARIDWAKLLPGERLAWAQRGPKGKPHEAIRMSVWEATMASLMPYTA